ncbi:MAG: AMP-binding protein [Gammaproteobacteria bacterium]|nr:AMP-binding protein [Gammaproteobacteria bacterium]
MNITQHLERGQHAFPNKPALIFEGRSFTYGEINELSCRVANALVSDGISPGDRVALFLPNIPSFVTVYFGIQKMGAAAVSINSALKANEIKFILDDSDAKAIVTTETLRANVPAEDLPQLKKIVIAEGDAKGSDIALNEWMADASPKAPAVDTAQSKPAVLLYTSGTTGFPKGAALSHGNMISTARACVNVFKMQAEDRVLLFLPLFHSFGQTTVLNPCLEAGATLVLQREFEIDSVLKSIVDNGVTTFCGVPAIYTLLYDKASSEQMDSVRRYISGAANLPMEIARKWREKFGNVINEGYGSTESSLACFNHNDDKFGSVGLPLEGVEIKIVDAEGDEAAPDELGEVTIRGPNVMLGYWNRPAETADAIKDGRFYTGDIGKMDDDGHIYIADRIKDMVNIAGIKVYPSEIENILYQHQAIAEAAVYGVQNALLNEQVHASVILKPESAVAKEEIMAFCRQRMADFKVPSVIKFVDSLPKGRTGKILKRILREQNAQTTTSDVEKHALPDNADVPSPSSRTHEAIKNWIADWLAENLELDIDLIETDKLFGDYGITSILAVNLARDLGDWLGCSLEPVISWNFPSIEAMAHHLKPTQDTKPDSFSDRQVEIGIPAEPEHSNAKRDSDIAVVALSGRYPFADNVETFWENLKQGMDCITEIPKDRWDHSLYFDADKNKLGKTCCKWGGFLDDVYRFDPLFFNISPLEAETMHPQESLFLETVWHLFESAGYTRDAIQDACQSRVGVFVGAMDNALDTELRKESAVSLSGIGAIANRVSYFFNFQGPSMAVNTMCSSAAVSIHNACESLIKGECKMAVAGGVNLPLHPGKYIGLSQTQMLASHADSRSFGDGDGFFPCEGVGAVLLKPLSEAIRDQDAVLAVIKSTAVNHGGYSNGFMVPNPNAQAQLFEGHFRKSGIDPRTISYVEAAANGSVLGDPIEISALNKAFRKFTSDRQFCAIGSVKSNIGHPEAVAGMAQLTKAVLQMRHGQLVPSIKANPVNPNLSFDDTPFYLQDKLTDWQRPVIQIDGMEREFPRRATISSFGAGGSNAHLILEEYIPAQKEPFPVKSVVDTPHIAVFSAKTPVRLKEAIRRFIEFMKDSKETDFSDIVYTLQTGREAMEYRLAMVASNKEEMIRGMKEYLESFEKGAKSAGSVPVFTGTPHNDRWIRSLLTGNTGEAVLQALLAENDLEKTAIHWTRGGNIPWGMLHEYKNPRRMLLPVYPFEKRRVRTGEKRDRSEQGAPPAIRKNETESKQSEPGAPPAIRKNETESKQSEPGIEAELKQIVSSLLKLDAEDDLKTDRNLRLYGFDSLTGMKLIRAILERYDAKISPAVLLEHDTVRSLAYYLTGELQDVVQEPAAGDSADNIEADDLSDFEAYEFPSEDLKANDQDEKNPIEEIVTAKLSDTELDELLIRMLNEQ